MYGATYQMGVGLARAVLSIESHCAISDVVSPVASAHGKGRCAATSIIMEGLHVSITVDVVADEQHQRMLETDEGQFADLKAIDIAPSKVTHHASAFANSDGGELFIGIDEVGVDKRRVWRGFHDQEAANAHIQTLESLFPLGQDFQYTFLKCVGKPGLVLQVEIKRTKDIKKASNGTPLYSEGCAEPTRDDARSATAVGIYERYSVVRV
jgi:hypothetical protein